MVRKCIFFCLSLFAISCATPRKFNKKIPDNIAKLDSKKRAKVYEEFEIQDWSGLQGVNFYVGGESGDDLYTLESLRPTMSWVSRDLEDDLAEIEAFHQSGKYTFYTAAGLFSVAAAGYYSEEEEVYHISQSLGLLSLFLWVILEQWWQLKDQVQYQYNESLREKFGITWEMNEPVGLYEKKKEAPVMVQLGWSL